MISLFRAVKFAILDFARNSWLSLAAVLVMTITLFTIGLFLFLVRISNASAEAFKDRVEVSVFLKDEVQDDEIKNFREKLESRSDVKSLQFISKDEAFARYQERFGDNQSLTGLVTKDRNFLPRSFRIKTFSPDDLGNIERFIDQEEFRPVIRNFPFKTIKLLADRIVVFADLISKSGIALSALLIGISVIVIFNAISLILHMRADEIEIMRLVGATSMFIRVPFILTGLFYGLLGAVLSVFALLAIYVFYLPPILLSLELNDFPINRNLMIAEFPFVVMTIVAASVLVAVLATSLAIRRRLRV